jgi:hypothetical protein
MTSRWMLVGLALGSLCLSGYGQGLVTLVEHNGYTKDLDFRVQGDSDITILRPSEPERPFWFEAYYTDDPETEAPIDGIKAGEGLQGDVAIKVYGTEGRTFGASDVYVLDFDQAGVTSTVDYVNIQYTLGAAGPTYVTSVAGHLYAHDIESDVEIGGVPANGVVQFGYLNGYTLHVAGSAPGYIIVGL